MYRVYDWPSRPAKAVMGDVDAVVAAYRQGYEDGGRDALKGGSMVAMFLLALVGGIVVLAYVFSFGVR